MKVNALQEISKYMIRNNILSLAVSKQIKPWLCTLYYGIDKDLNIYVITDPNSINGEVIEKNANIAINIFDSHQNITNTPKGIQETGTIEPVKGAIENSKALVLWHKANPGVEKYITVEDILTKISDSGEVNF